MKKTTLILTTLLAAAVILPTTCQVRATPALGKAMDLTCTTCHDKPGSKLLTSQGKYYEALGTLDGYEKVISSFRECTSCHVRKPGSKKLTKDGRMFSQVIKDMHELRDWVNYYHPTSAPPADDPPDEGNKK